MLLVGGGGRTSGRFEDRFALRAWEASPEGDGGGCFRPLCLRRRGAASLSKSRESRSRVYESEIYGAEG